MWDQNPESNVTAYRIFIGTAAGSYSDTFDVPGTQTSFVYSRAVAGRRYYVAVAAQVDHVTWGPRSTEISGIAAAQGSDAASSLLTASIASDGGLAPASAGRSAPATSSVQVIATGLQPVSALAVSAAGAGLFVEAGHVVRLFEIAGRALEATPALTLDPDVQIQDIALDPAFDRTGRAFLAVSRTGRNGLREVAVERHRLLGGALGESSAVVPVLDGPLSARTLLAATADGRVVVAQPGLVRAFDGITPARLGGAPARPASVSWDDVNQTAWLTGTGAGGAAIVARLGGADGRTDVIALPAALDRMAAIAQIRTSGGAAIAGASGAAVVRFDLETGATTIVTAGLAAYGTPVLVAAPTGGDASWYVALRADRPGGSTSDTLVKVTAGSGAAQPID